MAIDLKKARDFVYSKGTLWERALFAYHFQAGSAERVLETLQPYKNPDNGFGHALEHDIRYPGSHPLALEFLLNILHQNDLPAGNLLDGVAEWVDANQKEDGYMIRNPELLDYPHAPWWNDGGQNLPDSIVAGLIRFGKANYAIITRTREWVKTHMTLDRIKSEEWLFMMYHAFDYFYADADFPDVAQFRQVTNDRIIYLATHANDDQLNALFNFAKTPESPIAKAIPDLIDKALKFVEAGQQPDGHWNDEHHLEQWFASSTIGKLVILRRFGRLD